MHGAGLSAHPLAPRPAEGTDPKAFAAKVLASAKSSFAFGMKTLRKDRREAMTAVYAFNRIVDDIADSDAPVEEKLALLREWRTEIDRLYQAVPRSAVGQALQFAVERFALPKAEFERVIDGMEVDANGPVVAPSMAELAHYTRCVAGTVGQFSVRCFGVAPGVDREVFALALADAFQLTNILRDVEEDAAIGRLYLPRELLNAHGAGTDPATIAVDPALPSVCRSLGAVARDRFAVARDALARLDHGKLRCALIFMGVYEGYLDRMEAADWSRTAASRPMGKTEKIARGLRYAFWPPRRAVVRPKLAVPFPERPLTDAL